MGRDKIFSEGPEKPFKTGKKTLLEMPNSSTVTKNSILYDG